MKDSSNAASLYSVSICAGGHATIRLGKTAVFLEISELRGLIQTAREVLQEYEEHFDGGHGMHLVPESSHRH